MSPPGSFGAAGQLFSKDTQAIFFNWYLVADTESCRDAARQLRGEGMPRSPPPLGGRPPACLHHRGYHPRCLRPPCRKQLPVQRMLDFDFLCGRTTPSVAVIVQPGSHGGFQKLFFGREESAIPQVGQQRLSTPSVAA